MLSGAEKKRSQVWMLRKLGMVAGNDKIKPVRKPNSLVKVSNRTPKVFGLLGMSGSQNPFKRGGITKQARLRCHHEVLSGTILHPIDCKRR
ncbi:MAG: hypothetical protein JWL59_636 [Chthoniobacteraceae bacterium]|nr:hypothetical protein [Chthoniobacteraceae bacterium]